MSKIQIGKNFTNNFKLLIAPSIILIVGLIIGFFNATGWFELIKS